MQSIVQRGAGAGVQLQQEASAQEFSYLQKPTMKKRFDEFDGLRGIAILMVMAYHIIPEGENLFSNPLTKFLTTISQMGWAGVDLFFVLSGFLITGILLEQKEKQGYFRNFYARRILRIFPVYYLSLTVLFSIYLLTGMADIHTILTTGLWYYSYQQNWIYSMNAGPGLYFSHFWSLAIEEQFYLVWPLIIYFANPKQIFRIGAVLIGIAFMLRIYIVFFLGDVNISNTFPIYSSVTRMDSLIVGGLLAVVFLSEDGRDKLAKNMLLVLSLSILVIGACIATHPASPLWNNAAMLTIGFSDIALLGGALIIYLQTSHPNNYLRAFFRNPVLTFHGKYSYAMYIFHWPIASLAITTYINGPTPHTGWVQWVLYTGGCYIFTLSAALISWNLVEKHALSLKRYFEPGI